MSWNRKDGTPTTVETIHDYLTDLQDLSENDEIPPSAFRDRGIWSLICREMQVKVKVRWKIVYGRTAAVNSGSKSSNSDAAKEFTRNTITVERTTDESTF